MARKIKWRVAGFQEIRRLPPIKADLAARAERIAGACGAGYEAKTGEGRTRSRAAVLTVDYEAIRDNAKNNTLLNNLGAGRGDASP